MRWVLRFYPAPLPHLVSPVLARAAPAQHLGRDVREFLANIDAQPHMPNPSPHAEKRPHKHVYVFIDVYLHTDTQTLYRNLRDIWIT